MTPDDDLKLLYTVIKLNPAKPRMEDVANAMGLKLPATTWRYRTLMTRLEKMHGKITGDGNGETADPIKQTSARKRKRNERQGATKKSETKKAKVDIGEKEDEADLTEATSSDDILTGNGKEA